LEKYRLKEHSGNNADYQDQYSRISSVVISEEEYHQNVQDESSYYSEQQSRMANGHNINLIAEMPILVEKINPPKFIQTTY
jgi:hypothetical protein